MASTQSGSPLPDEDYCTPQQVHVSPGSPAATSLHVFWVTDYNCTSIVMYGTTPDAFAASATFGLPPTRYRIEPAVDDKDARATDNDADAGGGVGADSTSTRRASSSEFESATAHESDLSAVSHQGREALASDRRGCRGGCESKSNGSSDLGSNSGGSSSSRSTNSSRISGNNSDRRDLNSASSSAFLPPAVPSGLEAKPYVSPYLHRVTLKELQPDTVYWLRLSGALVATPTTKDIAGRVELAEPFPVRTLRVPGPFVAPPQGLPTNLIDEWGAAESPALRVAVIGDLGHTLPLLSATVREALHADAFDVDKKKADGERKAYGISYTSSSSSSPSPDTSPPPPSSTSIAGGRTALLWLVGGLAHSDGDGEKWDAWGSALSDLIESLPVAAVASNHEIQVNPYTGEAFSHFRQRFQGPGEEIEEAVEAAEVEAAEAREEFKSTSSSPSPASQEALPDLNFDYDYGASYFCFDVGLVHFIGLNAYAYSAVGSRQYEWLVADLASVDRKTTPWVLAFVHGAWRRPEDDATSATTTKKPSPFSDLNHDSESDSNDSGSSPSSSSSSSSSGSSTQGISSPSPPPPLQQQPLWSPNALKVQAAIEPLLIKHEVGVLFAASDGVYGRTYPLDSDGAFRNVNQRGMTFVALGGGGTSPSSTSTTKTADSNAPTASSNSKFEPASSSSSSSSLSSSSSPWALSNGATVGRGDLLVVNETHLRWRWWATGSGALNGPDDDVWLKNPYGLPLKANSPQADSMSSTGSKRMPASMMMPVAAVALVVIIGILLLCICRKLGTGKNHSGQAYDVLPTQKPNTTKYQWNTSNPNTSATTSREDDGDSDSNSSGGGRYSERMRRLDAPSAPPEEERSRIYRSRSLNRTAGEERREEKSKDSPQQRHAKHRESAAAPSGVNQGRASKPPPRRPTRAPPPAAIWQQLREKHGSEL